MSTNTIRYTLATAIALALAPCAQAAPTHSGTWWNPDDSGWGITTIDQGSVLGPYWFTYDEAGRPTWFMGVALPQADGSYAGDLYRFTGLPLTQISQAPGRASQPGTVVGTVHLDFDADPKKLDFSYRIGGQTTTRALQRFNFSGKHVLCSATNAPRADATNYTDMWWEPATSGWGIHLQHLDEHIYGQWYTYEAPNRAVFMTLGLTRQADGSYAGKVYRQNDGQEVGSASMVFLDGTRAEFEYRIGSTRGSHVMQRFQVGTLANVCAVQPYSSGDGDDDDDDGGNGAGEACHPPYRIGDSRTLRSTSTSNGTAAAPHTFIEAVTVQASFNGQAGLVQTISGQTSAGNGVYARNYVGNGEGSIASFGAEALDPSSGQVISTSRNDPARVEMSRSFQTGETVAIDFGVNSSSAAGNGRTEIKSTYRLLGREQVTVPAGTFDACKFEITVEESSQIAGATTRTQFSGISWTDAAFGRVKMQTSGTSTVTAYGFNTTTQIGGAEELLQATMNGQQRP